jgi:predicted dienelactone hydrolase
MSKAPRPSQVAVLENIGVRTLKYEDAKRQRPILVELWYPTQQSGPLDVPSDPVWIHPKEIRDVPVAEGRHPLIMMSHGHGGDRRDRSWLAEYLVKSGFIVASVEHHGNSWRSYNPLLSLRFWERARDISFAIDQLMKEKGLKDKINPSKIGFVGYSLGGMTGLALAGAKAKNVKEIIKLQQEHHREIDAELVDQIDFSEAQQSFADRRVKAMVLLTPAAFIYPPQSLKDVKIPVALVASEGDEVLPFEEHALKIMTHLVPTKLKLLKTSHYVFLNRVSKIGKDVVRQDLHTDPIETDRITVHKEVGVFASDFFKEQL